jgi:hypothetical protein
MKREGKNREEYRRGEDGGDKRKGKEHGKENAGQYRRIFLVPRF